MLCIRCGFGSADSAVFCGRCGAPLDTAMLNDASPVTRASSAMERKFAHELKLFGLLPVALFAGGSLLVIASLVLLIS
mgnify:CR=1 FL=1